MPSSTESRRGRLAAVGFAAAMLAACSSGEGDGAAPTSPPSATPAEDTSPTSMTTAAAPATTDAATTAAETAEPESTAPESTEPATTAPETTAPESTVPESTVPESTEGSTPCPQLPAGVTDLTLGAGGAEHPVRIFVPSSYAAQRMPIVLNWHGLGSNGPEQAAFSDYESLAEAKGFVVVHPTGVPETVGGPNSWELVDAQDSRDDLAFANALIDLLVADWCADPDRVYSTGMSNGGFFTSRLVCEVADRIAAAVSVAGTFHPEGCTPSRPVPYLAYHGTADQIVPFAGGGESTLAGDDSPERRAFFEQVMPDEFAEFAADAGCAADPASSAVGVDVTRYDYTGCAAGVPLAFFEITGGGHNWPGSPVGEALEGALGPTTQDVSATADGWSFFAQHTLTD